VKVGGGYLDLAKRDFLFLYSRNAQCIHMIPNRLTHVDDTVYL
jgi:hypothetical protein